MIEVMLVMVLLAFLTVAFASRLFSPNTENLKPLVRHLKVLSRELHSKAQLEKATYRIVLSAGYTPTELASLTSGPKNKSEKALAKIKEQAKPNALHAYWVEKAEEDSLQFIPDKKIMKKAKVLPKYLSFKDFLPEKDSTEDDLYPYTYLYYYPNGLSNSKLIHIGIGEDAVWSLYLHHLTGQLDVFGKEVPLEEVQEKQER